MLNDLHDYVDANVWGRRNELRKLKKLKDKQTASFVVLMGRRRIGKSTLAKEFALSFDKKII